MRTMSISQIRSEFDEFLYAQIEENGNGSLLSVLSALARLDMDPWQEAGNLTRMSSERATQRLASLISALPGRALEQPNAGTIAARLITLLPHHTSVNIAPGGVPSNAGALTQSRVLLMYFFIINMTFFALMLGDHFAANHPLHTNAAHAPAQKAAASGPPMPGIAKR